MNFQRRNCDAADLRLRAVNKLCEPITGEPLFKVQVDVTKDHIARGNWDSPYDNPVSLALTEHPDLDIDFAKVHDDTIDLHMSFGDDDDIRLHCVYFPAGLRIYCGSLLEHEWFFGNTTKPFSFYIDVPKWALVDDEPINFPFPLPPLLSKQEDRSVNP